MDFRFEELYAYWYVDTDKEYTETDAILTDDLRGMLIITGSV